MTARDALDRAMTEDQLQSVVIDLAHLRGWKVMHTRPAWSKGHMATPLQGDPGFPDLVIARRFYVTLFVELKTEKGKLTPDQENWRLALPGWHLWRPSDWSSGLIAEVLW